MNPRPSLVVFSIAVLSALSLPALGQIPPEPPIAGLAPDRRPADAPILGQFSPDLNWRARSLNGVSEPVPPTLGFIDSQGAWYTPFDRPGMTGPYDLRGWHARAGR